MFAIYVKHRRPKAGAWAEKRFWFFRTSANREGPWVRMTSTQRMKSTHTSPHLSTSCFLHAVTMLSFACWLRFPSGDLPCTIVSSSEHFLALETCADAGHGYFCCKYNARTVPVQCPYSARTVPDTKTYSARQIARVKDKQSRPAFF